MAHFLGAFKKRKMPRISRKRRNKRKKIKKI